MARDNLRCLPSTRTLRRIRWPLQPRSRDRPTAFGGVTTTERHSHVVLGLSRSSTLFMRTRGARLTSTSFARHFHRRSHADDRALLGPRSLLPPPFLRALRTSLFGARMLPADFCNLKHDVRTLGPGLPFPRRDDGHDHLPFLTPHARPPRVSPRSGETRRAAQSSVDQDPGAGLLPLAWACPTAISRPPHHLPRLAPREFSDD
jgi:hypothetical protein